MSVIGEGIALTTERQIEFGDEVMGRIMDLIEKIEEEGTEKKPY